MRIVVGVLLGAVTGLGGCVTPPAPGPTADTVITAQPDHYGVRFSHRDRMLIRDYYRRNPGLAQKQALPPGLEQRLFERGTLPPGVVVGETLPAELETRLSQLPEALIRRRIGVHVLLVDRDTRTIVDIIRDIGN